MQRTGQIATGAAGLALLVAAPVQAQAPPPVPPPAPAPPATAPAPPAAPKSGRATLEVAGGLASHGRSYFLTGDRVTVIGHVRPAVAGQKVRVRISSPHRRSQTVHARVRGG